MGKISACVRHTTFQGRIGLPGYRPQAVYAQWSQPCNATLGLQIWLPGWVSIERLMSELRQHAPAEVDKLGLKGVKQMITESQMDHPAFAGLPFSAWCKKL